MTAATIILAGHAVALTDDGAGLVGRAEIDGERVVIHATVTAVGPRSVSPAKWRRP